MLPLCASTASLSMFVMFVMVRSPKRVMFAVAINPWSLGTAEILNRYYNVGRFDMVAGEQTDERFK